MLYEDDFTSCDYEVNGFREIQISVNETEKMIVSGMEKLND
mgnify:CR=1 FL=1